MRYSYRNDGTIILEDCRGGANEALAYEHGHPDPNHPGHTLNIPTPIKIPSATGYWIFLVATLIMFSNIITLYPMYWLRKMRNATTQYDVESCFKQAKIGCVVAVAIPIAVAILMSM